MFRAPKRPRNQLHQTRLERRTHQLAAQLRQSESGDPRYPPAEHRQHRSASTLRKTKFVVLAMAALASAAAELPPPMFEHLAMDQARCRNPLYSGSIHGESSPSRQAAQSCVWWQGMQPPLEQSFYGPSPPLNARHCPKSLQRRRANERSQSTVRYCSRSPWYETLYLFSTSATIDVANSASSAYPRLADMVSFNFSTRSTRRPLNTR